MKKSNIFTSNNSWFLLFFYSVSISVSALMLHFAVTYDTNLIVVFLIPVFLLYYLSIKWGNQKLFFWFLFLFSIISGTYYFAWMTVYSFYLYPFAVFAWSFLLFSSFFLDTLFTRSRLYFPLIPFIWMVFVFLLDLTPLGGFLFSFAYFFPNNSPYGFYLKLYGISFIIMLFSQLIPYFTVRKGKKITGIILSFIYIFFIISSLWYSSNYKPKAIKKGNPGNHQLTIAVVQGNYRSSWELRKILVNSIVSEYIELTYKAYENHPFDIVFWPEYAIPGDIPNDPNLQNRIGSCAKKLGISIVTGCSPWIKGDPVLENYNTAVQFDTDGKLVNRYDSVLPLPYDIDVKPGKEYRLFEIKGYKFGIQMCYEEVFNNITKKYIDMGADFLVVLANHAMFDKLKGLYQTTLLSRVHASSYKKYIVRATNSGISLLIAPTGSILKTIPILQPGYFIMDIYPED